jgi:nucleotide-binding universal stress UspA family protein
MKTLVKEHSTALSHYFETETISGSALAEINVETVIVPLDFSELSLEALRYATVIGKKFGAAIHLVHVSDEEEAALEISSNSHSMRQTAISVESLSDELLGHGKQVGGFWPEECHVRKGQPYQEICTLADEIDASLIVLGTRGHTGLKRILLGSTAERVARFAACPVLVVRPSPSWKRKRFVLQKILAPIDFSRCSMVGAMYAALFAKTFGAKLSLLHVLAGEMPLASGKASRNSFNKNGAIDLENARLDMEAFTQLDFLRDVKPETDICAGDAADEICRIAGDSVTDLVVISTHGRTGLNRVLLGSVAEHVLRHAECPVLVTPNHSSTF